MPSAATFLAARCLHPEGTLHVASALRGVGTLAGTERGVFINEEDLSRSADQRRIVGSRCIRQRTRNFDGWVEWSRSQAMLGRGQQGGSRRKRHHRDWTIRKYYCRLNSITRLKLWHFFYCFFRYECQCQCFLAPTRNAGLLAIRSHRIKSGDLVTPPLPGVFLSPKGSASRKKVDFGKRR